MKQLRQLTPRETFFIGGETSRVYQHTGGLVILDASDRPDFNFELFRERFMERMANVPQFQWKLHEVPLGLDLPYWVEDENFSFDNHIRRVAVPSPGDRKALAELVAYLYSRHLDRSRPLWETWFVEGVGDRQYGIVQKFHHCLMDGEGATRLGERLVDLAPDAEPRPVDPQVSQAQPGRKPGAWEASFKTARHLSRLPLRMSREIYAAAAPQVKNRLGGGSNREKVQTPLALFNNEISPHRGFAFGSLPMDDVKTIKSHFGVTVNDVVLAIVSGSLRSYLLERDALPEESLRTSIPISLRTEEDDELSNRTTAAAVSLATVEPDPVQRLVKIAGECDVAKNQARGGASGFMEIMQTMPPLLINVLMNISPPHLAPSMTGTNLIVSNVRGSPWPLYTAGARQTGMYPMSIITPGAGMNITCISYAGSMDFGITVEPNLIPDPWPLIEGLERSLAEYKALAGKRGRGRLPKKKAGRIGSRPARAG